MKYDVLIVVVGIALLAALWVGWSQFTVWRDGIYGGENVACTMDAMMCPDGTYVGRVPPSCEFAPCPGY